MKSRPPQSKPNHPQGTRLPPAPVSPARKWLFRGLAGILIPLLVLGILEAALRLGGYGYATNFFKPLRIGDREFLVENDQFGFRFFPPNMARMPAPLRMPATKPPGTYRIFILGGSAAMGDPEPAFGVGRYLDALLRERFPDEKFEVVNVAMTAINSHVVLPIARDCARQDGNLWIIYMGNNEMVGPFGAATVFGAQAPPWPLVRLDLALQKSRLGQWLTATGRKLKGKPVGTSSWNGMKMFAGNQVAPDDPRRDAVYRNFARNLQDIVQTGLDSGAQVLLSTVVVNLKDCPPFDSLTSPRLSPADRDRMVQLLAEGNTLMEDGNWAEAEKCYAKAGKLEPQSADLEFHWGNCLLQSTNLAAARMHFQNAVDLDCLPFRADSRINSLIAEAGRKLAATNLVFLDAVAALTSDSGDALPGADIFYEHVHFNFNGNYLLARAWAETIAPRLPASITRGAEPAWASQAACERRLGLTGWDRRNVLAEVGRRMQQPPLSSQQNNAGRLRHLSEQAASLDGHLDTGAAREIYLEAMKSAPEDYYPLENFAYFLTDTGDLPSAAEQWQKVRALIPQDHAAYYELGRLAARQGKFSEAQSWLAQAVAIHPSFAPGWLELGRAQSAGGDYQPAVQSFDQALKYDLQNAQTWFFSGVALARLGQRAAAIEHYQQAVKFAPDDWRAHFELGGLLGQDGKMAEAMTESAIAVRLNPDFPTAHLNLGMALAQLGRLAEAGRQFQATLQLDPTNAKAADYLSQTRTLLKGKTVVFSREPDPASA